ncbi:type I-E CRISPR-associated protein Cse1/CasA [Komagataeibacter medellinensis]|uniref:CRISPR-associated protein n=1 Tax=Komagataeibacter medellinensis (strain NBRC 3288 / BCRC 11682 / LMG 1693 / Kondo 51) TaxID=634177 RepID=G2I4Z7_KOMMN|nr:type I-E CRISPR-associated protein Cse1/CasA [Komagataeibacter medellinensis]BAK83194.1 hypothetical protein GLX_07820 [Komagataeibacter medellinensis NBRC 3288]
MTQPLNLISDPWLPVRHRSGARSLIRPAQIVAGLENDPIIDFDWPRADFRIASLEFLIGLLATACPPADHRAWGQRWCQPPTVAALDAAFAPLVPAFWLDGPGPRFMQDHEDLQSGSEPVERLLIDAPGESTIKRNADLFVHRAQVGRLGRGAAAMALFTLQSWAPSGGAGNMTGLRGGGPLTTLVLPEEGAGLWAVAWANVPCGSAADPAAMSRIFPWMAPTIASGNKGVVREGVNAHALQCWWGMPRRIRLDFAPAQGAPCDLTGRVDDVLVTSWRQRPYGPKYAGWIGQPYGGAVIHPLTPRYRQKATTEWLAVHPQPGGIGYRHWTGVVVSSTDTNRLPASCVADWRNARAVEIGLLDTARLLAAGFDMDNMKARGFVESEMPLPGTQGADMRDALDDLARDCVGAAVLVADILRGCVRDALAGKGTVSVDVTLLANVRERFWLDTETGFFNTLRSGSREGSDDMALKRAWLGMLGQAARRQFDATVKLEPDTDPARAQACAWARTRLFTAVAGTSKEGVGLLNMLALPVPVKTKTKTARKGA